MYKDLNINSEYEISSSGIIRCKKTKQEVDYRITPDGYKVAYISSKDNSYPKRRIHRLVYEHFIDPNIKNKEINHIDGNKLNNDISNLEIVEHRQNMLHARDNDLLSNHRKFKVKNVNTGVIKNYPSLTEFCRENRLNKLTVLPLILDSGNKPIRGTFSFVKPPKDIDTEVNRGGKAAKVITVKYSNGKEKTFRSISSASYSLRLPRSTITVGLKNNEVFNVNGYKLSYKS